MASTVVRTTHNRQLLDEWSLVLTAADIPHTTPLGGGNYLIAVEAAAAARTVAVLADYDDERRRRMAARWIEADAGSRVAWLVAAAILVGYAVTGPVDRSSPWFEAGAAIATEIRGGELWRIVTALTLHADAMHAVSNAASSLVFLIPLSRAVGSGSALSLSVAAGAAATWLNAYLRGPLYAGIGASTAVFATVGLLAGLRVRRDGRLPLWRQLGPFGAALGILAMLGASPQTDVIAHLLGLGAGVSAGALLAAGRGGAFTPETDAICGVAAVTAVVGAWIAALLLA